VYYQMKDNFDDSEITHKEKKYVPGWKFQGHYKHGWNRSSLR
jgi:hypothetical protein